MFTIIRNPIQLFFGFNSFILSILLLPLLSIVLTTGLIVFAILAWKEGFRAIVRPPFPASGLGQMRMCRAGKRSPRPSPGSLGAQQRKFTVPGRSELNN